MGATDLMTWEDLRNYFFDLVPHPRYGEIAREMVKLLIHLRAELDTTCIHAASDHLEIVLSKEGTPGWIYIANEDTDRFTITIQHPTQDLSFAEENNVPAEYVAPLVTLLIEQLSNQHYAAPQKTLFQF